MPLRSVITGGHFPFFPKTIAAFEKLMGGLIDVQSIFFLW